MIGQRHRLNARRGVETLGQFQNKQKLNAGCGESADPRADNDRLFSACRHGAITLLNASAIRAGLGK